MNLAELCHHLRHRRRMYLLDDRFPSAVAFVQGFDAALDGVPLAGFGDYVADEVVGHRSTLHWAYLVASTRVPAALDRDVRIDQLDAELTDRLVELLEGFRAKSTDR